MKQVKLTLSLEESLKFEYTLFQLQALENAVNMFLKTEEFTFNEEHVNIIVEKYTEAYAKMKKEALELVSKYSDLNINIVSFGFHYKDKVLVVNY